MKRKILSLILVAALLASMVVLAPTASAAENVATIKTTDAVGFAGDEVTVDVTISVDSFAGFQLAFVYDSSRLTYNGVSYDQTGSSFAPSGAAENQQFVNNGPYTLIGRAWQNAEGKPFLFTDCVDTKFATLSFTIKEDAPIGDAYVEFCPLDGVWNDAPYAYDLITRSAQLGACDDVMYEGSKVTVLPEGYSTESVAPVVNYLSQDDVDNGVLSYRFNDSYDGVIITGYAVNTYSGIVVLPSVINDTKVDFMFEDYPVVGIDSQAFYDSVGRKADTSATAFVIPESVTEIAGAAFFQCAAVDYYVMNADCVIAPYAMGTTGNIANNKYFINNKNLVAGTTTSIITIHGAANAQTYAETVVTETTNTTYPAKTFSYSANTAFPTENKVTFDGNSYFALTGSTIPAPGVGKIGGATVIGWSDGVNSYAPGADITVTADLTLEPITIAAPATSNVVDFKLTANEADLAMRFTSNLSRADYNKLAALGTVSFGMLITPAAYVAKAGSFTKEALNTLGAVNGAYVDIAIGGYYQKTNTDYIFAGSLKGFSAKTLAKNPDFASVLYVNVKTAAGDVFTVYGDFNFEANQNVKGVATALSTSDALNDTQKEWLVTLVDKFTA